MVLRHPRNPLLLWGTAVYRLHWVLIPSFSKCIDACIYARKKNVVQTKEVNAVIGIQHSLTLHVVKEIIVQDGTTLKEISP